MPRYHQLAYLPTMFGACMLFMTLYAACLVLWVFFPDLPGHAVMANLFPQFELLTLPSFVYGLVATALYGWFVAVVFVFFYNLWGPIVRIVTGGKDAARESIGAGTR